MADLSDKIASLSPQQLALLRRKLLEKGSARPAGRSGRRRPSSWAPLALRQDSLWALGATEHLLLTTLHHIVSDGWSGGVLLAELAALYGARQARLEGHRSVLAVLPELPVQYADYAVWQRGWLSGEVMKW